MTDAEKAFEEWASELIHQHHEVDAGSAWLAACRWRAQRDVEIAGEWCRGNDEPRCSGITDTIEEDAGLRRKI